MRRTLLALLLAAAMPAFAQQRTVHWLKWVDFVPATDALLKREMMPEAEKALGIKINLETVNGNDLQPRITAGIQSGAGAQWLQPRLFVGWQKGRWHEKVGRQKRNAPETRGGATGANKERKAVQRL